MDSKTLYDCIVGTSAVSGLFLGLLAYGFMIDFDDAFKPIKDVIYLVRCAFRTLKKSINKKHMQD